MIANFLSQAAHTAHTNWEHQKPELIEWKNKQAEAWADWKDQKDIDWADWMDKKPDWTDKKAQDWADWKD